MAGCQAETYFEQQLSDLVVSIGAGVVQRNQAAVETHNLVSHHNTNTSHVTAAPMLCPPFVLGMDVGSVLQQQLDDADTVVARSQVEGRGLQRERERGGGRSPSVSQDLRDTA